MTHRLILVALLVAAVAQAQPADPEVHGTYLGDPMYSLLPLDAIPAVRAIAATW